MPTRLVLGFAFLLLIVRSSAAAPPIAGAPLTNLCSIQIEDLQGMPLPSYRFRGKSFVLGENGDRYNVRVVNHSGQRVEAVVSIDGRDAVSGEIADFTRQRGYVIGPYASVLISGFRESLENVRGFRFTNPSNSYSARRGTPENVGVIGLAVFRERQEPRLAPLPLQSPSAAPRKQESRRDQEAPEASSPKAKAGSGAASSAAERADRDQGAASEPSDQPRHNLGTEYAERLYSPVYEVPFIRARSAKPQSLISLYYDDEAGLTARGIVLYPPRDPNPEPQAFPINRFAPPPPGCE